MELQDLLAFGTSICYFRQLLHQHYQLYIGILLSFGQQIILSWVIPVPGGLIGMLQQFAGNVVILLVKHAGAQQMLNALLVEPIDIMMELIV